MKKLMDTCMNKAIELVLDQIDRVTQAKARRVKVSPCARIAA